MQKKSLFNDYIYYKNYFKEDMDKTTSKSLDLGKKTN